MSNVFGKYTPYNTIIHRLDPRIKFFALIALMVMCFLPYGNYANRFIVLGVHDDLFINYLCFCPARC